MDSRLETTCKPVRVACPTTSTSFKIRLNTQIDWLAKHWRASMSVRCPNCGNEHSYVVKDVYLSEAIADDSRISDLIAA